jgi:ClpP class serine protease
MIHPISGIMQFDSSLFEDCMRAVEGPKGDLMINSPGGDANAAEKMLKMCRFRFKEKFNVIIPNYAKSAATLIALGADRVFMGYL